jgi:hypothetical protein
MATEDVSLDLSTLLSSEERDFLIRNNGDQVLLLAYEFLDLILFKSTSSCLIIS